ncbi:E-selectin-like [Brachyhypopomus gauderio]|uniref:E-selectin-like n=1 Tax=Brachyhypopomus gauderio TaxID=698409 RepID=UPI004042EC24
MTWDEANEYCRSHHNGLACLNSESQSLYLDKTDTNSLQTSLVWAGLRFLNGRWIWVNGKQTGALSSLPSCPAPDYRCGARNLQTNLWENRNCEERLNVLCY